MWLQSHDKSDHLGFLASLLGGGGGEGGAPG